MSTLVEIRIGSMLNVTKMYERHLSFGSELCCDSGNVVILVCTEAACAKGKTVPLTVVKL